MSTKPDETLKALLETAKGARLSPADEEQATALLKQTLGEGKKGLAVSLEALTILPWNLGVKAVTETWPELKPTARRQFLAALIKLDSDQGRRMRLSIARGLFPVDQPVALKLILGFCAEFDPAEPKERQHFTNVLIGKTKPWILNLSLEGLKPAELNALLKFTLAASQQTPAFTQIWIFGWLSQAGLFEKLSEEQVATIATTAKRWQPKWQKELKKAVPTLPAPIEEALNTPPPQPQPQAQPQTAQKPQPQSKKGGRQEQSPRNQKDKRGQAPQPRQANQAQETAQPSEDSEAVAPTEQASEGTGTSESAKPTESQAEQTAAQISGEPSQRSTAQEPRQQNPQQQRGGGQQQPPQQRPQPPQRANSGGFDLQRNLGEIQSYVNGLKSEIQQLKNQLRQREPRRPEPREKEHPTLEELETLRRHNAQLEDTAAQLRRDIEEMISDHEDRAATLESSGDLQQFKALLGVKLGKDYFDFEALRRESATEVVRRHLGDLLSHIFSVLKNEGVEFQDQE